MIQILKKNIINLRGSRLSGKIVVFESDDWGSIRIPNKNIQRKLIERGLINPTNPFSKFDALETSGDFEALFNVLSKFKDTDGNNPLLTANIILNNPDFSSIKMDKFENFHQEPFYETYKANSGSETAFEVMKMGIAQKLFLPQFHGSEHLNVARWMNLLKSGNTEYNFAFENGCFALDFGSNSPLDQNFMATYDFKSIEELAYIEKNITNGLKLFESIFGYKSTTTVAPCYVWDSNVENFFYKEGIKGIQCSFLQKIPSLGKRYKRKYLYTGQKNEFGQVYSIRNAIFEPCLNHQTDWVDKCLESVNIAFRWNKPAIIGTHRINFCGQLDENQRNKNLKDFENLISRMLETWPDIRFMSSNELFRIL